MTRYKKTDSPFTELRHRAKERLRGKTRAENVNLDKLTPQELCALLHELRIHEAELELQNEELRQTQLELECSRSRYFELYDLAPCGYLTLDRWGLIEEANLTAARLLRRDRGKLIRQPFTRFIHSEAQDNYYLLQKQLLASGTQKTCELRMVCHEGSLFWARLEVVLDRDEGGKASPYRVVILDISKRKQAEDAVQKARLELEQRVAQRTAELARSNKDLQHEIKERKHAEGALQESEARYRSLVENANEAIVVIQDDVMKFANPMAEQILNLPGAAIIVHPFMEFIYPDDRNIILERQGKRLRGEQLENPFTVRLMDHDGNIKIISKNSAAIQWAGRPATLAMFTDITTAKIMEDEMLKADKLDALGILAGGIAHDFNNYLAILLANINLAKLYGDDLKKIQEKLDNMEKATLRARDLSNQLFTFSRGGAPVKQKFCIRQLILDSIKFTFSGSCVSPCIFIAPDLHMVEVDKGQLGQVLSNITINALQAMPEGGVLEVRAENVALGVPRGNDLVPLADGPYVKITIRDEGTGIPEKCLKKIFDPFFTTKDKGRGLGLATSYSIIKNHGGHIKVESELGVGTSFSIYLPALRGGATGPAAGENVFKGTGRILIMDDEEDLLTATGESLSTLGYEVALARDGREAIAQYLRALNNEQPFALVILDLTIPGGMGGKQAIRELLDKDPQVKAIVASGYSNDPVMANFGEYGFKAVVQKPFTIETLSKVVYEAMG